ncbi:MAG: MFS transporter, partial [Caulobacterales bacterium]
MIETDVAAPAVNRAAWTLTLCFMGALAEGFDVQSMGVAAPGLAPALGLTRDQLGPAFSASIVGLLIGAVLIGRLADRVGRKWTLVSSLSVFGVFSLATAMAWDFTSLLWIRLFVGLGLGGAMPNLIALCAEATPEQGRSRIVSLAMSGMPFGGALAGLVAAVLDWRGVFHVGGGWPLAMAALMALSLPESERFQAARVTSTARSDFRKVLFGEGRAGATLLLWAARFATLLTLYM